MSSSGNRPSLPRPRTPDSALHFGLTWPETDAYAQRGAQEEELTLRAAATVTPEYVFTLEQTSARAATPEA